MAVTVSWNIARRHEPWRQMLRMDADVALLQEAAPPDDVVRLRQAALPPADQSVSLDIGPKESWDSHSWNANEAGTLYDRWPMVVRLSDRVDVEWFRQVGALYGSPGRTRLASAALAPLPPPESRRATSQLDLRSSQPVQREAGYQQDGESGLVRAEESPVNGLDRLAPETARMVEEGLVRAALVLALQVEVAIVDQALRRHQVKVLVAGDRSPVGGAQADGEAVGSRQE